MEGGEDSALIRPHRIAQGAGKPQRLFLYRAAAVYLTILWTSVRMADMLKIRMQRVGRVNNPSFRFVVTDSQNATRSGKFLEVLGSFDYRKGGVDTIDAERVKHWISKGAQVTDNVHNYLVGKKILTGKKKNVNPVKVVKKEEPKAEAKAAPVAAPAEAPAVEAPKA